LVEQNTFSDANGITMDHSNGTVIRNNVILRGAVYFSGAPGLNRDVRIYNNTFVGSSLVVGGGITLGGVTGADVSNNLITGIPSGSFQLNTYHSDSLY